jgi:hypothetical protein
LHSRHNPIVTSSGVVSLSVFFFLVCSKVWGLIRWRKMCAQHLSSSVMCQKPSDTCQLRSSNNFAVISLVVFPIRLSNFFSLKILINRPTYTI